MLLGALRQRQRSILRCGLALHNVNNGLAMSALTTAYKPNTRCLLTGEKVVDWGQHLQSEKFIHAHALASAFANGRNVMPYVLLWDRLTTSTKLIEEFNSRRVTKRLARVSQALKFLAYHHVLLHSIYMFDEAKQTWNVTNEFGRVEMVGERLLKNEVMTRIMRVLPTLDAPSYEKLCDKITSKQAVVEMFEKKLHLEEIFPIESRSKTPLTDRHKVAMFYALLGEMHWFIVKTKATDRTHNNALFPPSDALILHVLCGHCLEGLIGEMIFAQLGPLADQVRHACVNFHTSVPWQLKRRSYAAGKLALNLISRKPTVAERRSWGEEVSEEEEKAEAEREKREAEEKDKKGVEDESLSVETPSKEDTEGSQKIASGEGNDSVKPSDAPSDSIISTSMESNSNEDKKKNGAEQKGNSDEKKAKREKKSPKKPKRPPLPPTPPPLALGVRDHPVLQLSVDPVYNSFYVDTPLKLNYGFFQRLRAKAVREVKEVFVDMQLPQQEGNQEEEHRESTIKDSENSSKEEPVAVHSDNSESQENIPSV